jgi:TolB-like protein
MKRFALILLALSCIALLPAQSVKKTIAVLDLDPTGITPADAQFLTNRLRSELFQTGAFQVVERDKMNTILQEQGFQHSGCTTVECAVEIGQLLNVGIIVAGSIGKIEELYSISLRMIDVQSGMIIKTATRDYRGKLSEVLTEVIPDIAVELAGEETKTPAGASSARKTASGSQKKSGKIFGVQAKVGLAFLAYTKDANDAIARSTMPELFSQKYPDHNNLAFEFGYLLSPRLQVKMGLGIEKMLQGWVNDKYFTHIASNISSFANKFKFTNVSLGLNYYLVRRPENYDWYVGSDIGTMQLQTHVTSQTVLDEVFDKTFIYNAFAFKLTSGIEYFFYKSFRVGLELGLQFTGNFDLHNQQVLPASYTVSIPYEIKKDLLLLRNITGSGIQMNLLLGYNF